jgi:glucokinase
MKYAIGVDVGATKIRGVLARSDGKILISREIETRARRKRMAILADIFYLINWLKRKADSRRLKLEGVGIGVPGTLKKGKIIFGGGTIKQFIGVNFKKLIQKKIGLKTAAENDSACFALAESVFGAGKNYRRVAGVIWGSGIGSGIIDKKKKIRKAVEMGHFLVEPNAEEPKDACGERGCVENLASGKNIIRRYYAKGGKISAKGGSASGGKNAGVKEIYRSKEKIAKEVLEDAYKYLGMGISILIRKVKPEIVVIGGGVSNLPPPAHKRLKNYIHKYAPKSLTKNLKIAKSRIGAFSGSLGAAMLVSRGG